MLTGWVPFHDVDEKIGTIAMVEGSHLWPEQKGLDFWNADLDQLGENFNSAGHEIKIVPMIIPRGHVSFHNCLYSR